MHHRGADFVIPSIALNDVIPLFNRAVEGNESETIAIGECVIADGGDAAADGHRGKGGAPVECVIADGGDAAADGH